MGQEASPRLCYLCSAATQAGGLDTVQRLRSQDPPYAGPQEMHSRQDLLTSPAVNRSYSAATCATYINPDLYIMIEMSKTFAANLQKKVQACQSSGSTEY